MKHKIALDNIIKKSRVHFYKPIQIAEILYKNRVENYYLSDLESYRNISKKWRDEISDILVGRKSTSSQKYQDSLFDDNEMPHNILIKLAEFNKYKSGMIEAYIYHNLNEKLKIIRKIYDYITTQSPKSFKIEELINFFDEDGLKKSIDKMYEIIVYALFSTLIKQLNLNVTVSINDCDLKLKNDFSTFLNTLVGLNSLENSKNFLASIYRIGVTNAADFGIDMICNFGTVIQVKHLCLNEKEINEIKNEINVDKVLIVCTKADSYNLLNYFNNDDLNKKIQGIVTIEDIKTWYNLCLNKHESIFSFELLNTLAKEFSVEFPVCTEIDNFLEERKYKSFLFDDWDDQKVKNDLNYYNESSIYQFYQ